eukprot:UN24932
MKKHKTTFETKDTKRYNEYLEALKKGDPKVKVNVGSKQPYEILSDALSEDETTAALAEGQWRTLVEKLTKTIDEDKRNVVASVDVSGSMYDIIVPAKKITRLHVALSLGLLFAEINTGPFNNYVVTFCDKPQLMKIEGKTLKEKYQWFTKESETTWGFQTNLRKSL